MHIDQSINNFKRFVYLQTNAFIIYFIDLTPTDCTYSTATRKHTRHLKQITMPSNYFKLTWESFKSNINIGFSQLQQKDEFVDMTLAAEGHLVKVHRNLIALASPYLKEMLQTAPCQHPVIFLHNISHKVLSLILEYIYMGEVQIPNDMLDQFIKACQTLYINGAKDIYSVKPREILEQTENMPVCNITEESILEINPQIQLASLARMADPNIRETSVAEDPHPPVHEPCNFAAHITINNGNYNLNIQSNANEMNMNECVNNDVNQINHDDNQIHIFPLNDGQSQIVTARDAYEQIALDVPILETSNTVNRDTTLNDIMQSNDCTAEQAQPTMQPLDTTGIPDLNLDIDPQYSVTNRGSLQIILNRYIYNRHHVSGGGRKQRWRCIDYRRKHCPAAIDTDGDTIVNRKGAHCHLFHDNAIHTKFKKNKVFTSMTSALECASKILS